MKIDEYIDNIEQLGADARFEKSAENYEKLLIYLKSIKYWASKAINEIEKEIEQEEVDYDDWYYSHYEDEIKMERMEEDG